MWSFLSARWWGIETSSLAGPEDRLGRGNNDGPEVKTVFQQTVNFGNTLRQRCEVARRIAAKQRLSSFDDLSFGASLCFLLFTFKQILPSCHQRCSYRRLPPFTGGRRHAPRSLKQRYSPRMRLPTSILSHKWQLSTPLSLFYRQRTET